ncbi:hypothetical protein BJX65DRAFT_148494 [Aspergillus insuetus]
MTSSRVVLGTKYCQARKDRLSPALPRRSAPCLPGPSRGDRHVAMNSRSIQLFRPSSRSTWISQIELKMLHSLRAFRSSTPSTCEAANYAPTNRTILRFSTHPGSCHPQSIRVKTPEFSRIRYTDADSLSLIPEKKHLTCYPGVHHTVVSDLDPPKRPQSHVTRSTTFMSMLNETY